MKFWMFHLMSWPHLPDDFEEKYDTAWVTCPNTLFDPARGPEVCHSYINQLAYADELGFDDVVINEHHQNAYGIMPSPQKPKAVSRKCGNSSFVIRPPNSPWPPSPTRWGRTLICFFTKRNLLARA